MPYTPPSVLTQGIDIEYTGTPIYPIAIGFPSYIGLIPVVAQAGRKIYFPSGAISGWFNYNETATGIANFGGLQTIKFWNLVQSELFSLDGCLNLTSLSAPELVVATSFNAGSGPALTTFDFPKLAFISGNFNPTTYPVLTNLSLPSLTRLKQAFAPTTMALLTTLGFPLLEGVGGSFTPSTMAALTSLSFPELLFIGANFAPTTMALVTTFSFPKLATISGTFAPTTMAALVTMSLPLLANIVGAVSVASMASLTTISFAGMANYGSTITFNSGLGNLTSVTLGTIGTLNSIAGATINISGQKLTQANVNAILALLISLNGTNGTTLWGAGKTLNVSGGTSGAPSGQGITDKAALVVRGATITTN